MTQTAVHLPSPLPGHQAGSAHPYHIKHALAAFVLVLLAWTGAWLTTGKRTRDTMAPASTATPSVARQGPGHKARPPDGKIPSWRSHGRQSLTRLGCGQTSRPRQIVMHALDRICRNLREVLKLVHDLAGRGIGVRSWPTRSRLTPRTR